MPPPRFIHLSIAYARLPSTVGHTTRARTRDFLPSTRGFLPSTRGFLPHQRRRNPSRPRPVSLWKEAHGPLRVDPDPATTWLHSARCRNPWRTGNTRGHTGFLLRATSSPKEEESKEDAVGRKKKAKREEEEDVTHSPLQSPSRLVLPGVRRDEASQPLTRHGGQAIFGGTW